MNILFLIYCNQLYISYIAINFTFPALKCYFDCYILRNVSTLYTIWHGRICTCIRDHVAAAVAVLCMERKQLCCIIYKDILLWLIYNRLWPVGTANVPSPSSTMCAYIVELYKYTRPLIMAKHAVIIRNAYIWVLHTSLHYGTRSLHDHGALVTKLLVISSRTRQRSEHRVWID